MRVLIAEDEERLADTLARGLRRRGWSVDVVHDGDDALGATIVHEYDVVVLDRDLPGTHGDEVCQALRRTGHPARVLMLTAAASTADLVAGLGLGADDYLGKPFDFDELAARLSALARRPGLSLPPVLERADIRLDPGTGTARRNGSPLDLTPREFAVLEILMRAQGRLVSAEELFEKAWDERADPLTTSVRVILSRVRRKLGDPDPIVTVTGRGYRL